MKSSITLIQTERIKDDRSTDHSFRSFLQSFENISNSYGNSQNEWLSDLSPYGKAIVNPVGAVFELGVNVTPCITAFCTLVY
jgi:hypothetical protein